MNTALLLGAKSDIAKAIARQLAMRNVNLLLAARIITDLADFKDELQAKHNIVVGLLEFDALDLPAHADFVQALPPQTDAVFCVFGYLGNQQIAQSDEAERKLIWDTNYTGAVSVLDFIAVRFKEQQRGSIVGVSSVAGDRLRASNYYYGKSKAAFSNYLSSLQEKLQASNIHVLTVKPGFVKTQMTRHLKLPPLISSSAEAAGKKIVDATYDRKSEIYVLGVWRYIMWGIKLIPESIFKRMNL